MKTEYIKPITEIIEFEIEGVMASTGGDSLDLEGPTSPGVGSNSRGINWE